MSDDQLRDLLTSAVPDLPGPEDRVAEVGRRVRRTRLRTGGTVAGAALVAVALLVVLAPLSPTAHPVPVATGPASPSIGPEPAPDPLPTGPVPDPPTLATDGCPASWPDPFPLVDRPGLLVPQDTPVSVTLCELPVEPSDKPLAHPPRVLRTGAAEIVTLLDKLPTGAQLRARMPGSGDVMCTAVGYTTNESLVVRYPGRAPVEVLIERNCGKAYSDGRTRYLDPSPVPRFLDLYRAQVAAATDPAKVPTPLCGPALTAHQLDPAAFDSQPADDIRANQNLPGPFLQSPIVAVTACRYAGNGNGVTLVRQVSQRTGMDEVENVLNRGTQVHVATDANGTTSVTNHSDCGDPNRDRRPVTALDVVWVADATGATAEVRVWRAPCQVVFTSGTGGLVPTQELLAQLDTWLT